jgi:UDP-GlcNAc:undecaprenyl-phosphate GlcNAc-1-phosphate transferase
MACGALIPILLWASMNGFGHALLAGSAVIVLFGFIDDLMDLPYKAKFLAQVAAALIVIHFGHLQLCCLGSLAPDDFRLPATLAIPLTAFVIVGVTNAINLSDGLDGLAGGISLMTFICCRLSGLQRRDVFTMTLSVAVIGAIFGFLRFQHLPGGRLHGGYRQPAAGISGDLPFHHLTQGNQPLSPLLPLILLGSRSWTP